MSSSFAFLTSFLPSISLPSLPSLASLPQIPIPQNLQNKLLSFLIQKSLGKYLKTTEGGVGSGGGLDSKIIESDLSKGEVKILGLELSKEAIEPLLSSVNPELSFESGTISSVLAKVTWPLTLSSTLLLEVNDLNLVLNLRRPSANSNPPAFSFQESSEEEEEGEDGVDHLSLSVASEFLKEELEEDSVDHLELLKSLESLESGVDPSMRVISETLRRSSSGSVGGGSSTGTKISLPGAFDSPFDDDDLDSVTSHSKFRTSSYTSTSNKDLEVKEVTLLASLIERILKRLNVKIHRINLRLILESSEDEGEKEEVEIRIEDVSFSNEDMSAEVEDIVEIGGIQFDKNIVEGIKSFRIRDARVLLKSIIPNPSPHTSGDYDTRIHRSRVYSTSSRSSGSSSSCERGMDQSTTSTLQKNISPPASPSLSHSMASSSSYSSSSAFSNTFEPFNDHDYDLSQSISHFPNSQEDEEHEESFHTAIDIETQFSSSSSSSSESEDNDHFLAMSQSIVDLRSSTLSVSSSIGAGRVGRGESSSMYASARDSLFVLDEKSREEQEVEEQEQEEDSPFFDPDDAPGDVEVTENDGDTGTLEHDVYPMVEEDKDAEEPMVEEQAIEDDADDDGFRTIFSLGKDEIVLVLSTDKIQPDSNSTTSSNPSAPSTTTKKSKPELNLQCKISNPIKVLLLPHQLFTLINLVQVLLPSSSTTTETVSPLATHHSTPTKSKFSFNAAIRVKSITFIQVYELSSFTSSSFTKTQSEDFWATPTLTTIPYSHLKCKIEDFGLVVTSSTNSHGLEVSIPIRTFSVLEAIKSFHNSDIGVKVEKIRFLPIIIEDKNLLLQDNQNQTSGTSSWVKKIDSTDWTMENKNSEARGWKLPSLSTRASRKTGAVKVEFVEPALSLGINDGKVTINIQPVHLFLDLTLIERLQPFIEFIATSLESSSESNSLSATQTLPSTPKARPTTQINQKLSGISAPNQRILADLSFDSSSCPQKEALPSLVVNCLFLRIEIRCPPPDTERNSRRSSKLIWEEVRSGIAIIDIVNTRINKSGEHTRGLLEIEHHQEFIDINWESVTAYLLPVNTTQAIPFLSISALPSDPTDSMLNLSEMKPSIKISSIPSTSDLTNSRNNLKLDTSTPQFITNVGCDIPLLRISLGKSILDSLQFFIDDLTQFTSRTFGENHDYEGTDRNGSRIVGSRYFGTKSFYRSSRRLGSESEEGVGGNVEDVNKSMVFGIRITDVVVDLFVSKLDGDKRHLRGTVSDIDVKVELLKNSKNDLHVEASIFDLKFQDFSKSDSIMILSRTLAGNLTKKSIPLVHVNFTSSVEKESGVKESKVQVVLSNITYYLQADTSWLAELSALVRAPEGAFEAVVPNELTRVRIRIVDGTIHITPPTLTSRLVIIIGEAKVATNLMPDMPRTLTTLEIGHLGVFAINSDDDVMESDERSVLEMFWKSKGFVQLLNFERAFLQIRQGNGLVLPDLEVLLSESKLDITICADSAGTIQDVITDLSSFESSSIDTPLPIQTSNKKVENSVDLLASLDPTAFTKAQSIYETLEYLDDDVPSNPDYLSNTPNRKKPNSAGNSKLQSNDVGQIISDIDGETIRMLDPRGLVILEDYLAIPRTDPSDDPSRRPVSVIRCRMTECEINVHIHEGYDWAKTRKAIEEQAKVVRRRLEKIRQLLASGQTPDSSADEASVLMFGSIQLGLPPGSSELTNGQLLVAINEELDDASDTASSTSSWQPLSGQPQSTKPTLVGKSRKKLTRSSTFAIEINLRGINASFDSYSPVDQLASKIKLDVSNFDIIDNIRTSTWKKFLTELRPSDGGIVRASGASMIRFEMSKFRSAERSSSSSVTSNGEEIAMKIKINPLRLYIDQDALDFLKAFGSFKNPSSSSSSDIESTASTGPFFQRVEIMAVKIKLDYKPKRVDYHALRKGKIAELMNFFHFDGSEITLRHLVVTGISGSTRLSELVQDIWTPDVKANQLADVISGIAPVRSVVNVGSGVANLVLLPIEQYRKDGRLMRGLQKGATAFAKTTTLEALNVGARLATGTQVILEQAEAVLGARFSASVSTEALVAASPEGVTIDLTEEQRVDLISRYAEQPGDLREGLESAYRSLGTNFRSAAQTILAVPMEVYERSGTEGPVRAVIRAVPIAVLKPMIGATEAASKALFGLRNTLDKDLQAESADKYKKKT